MHWMQSRINFVPVTARRESPCNMCPPTLHVLVLNMNPGDCLCNSTDLHACLQSWRRWWPLNGKQAILSGCGQIVGPCDGNPTYSGMCSAWKTGNGCHESHQLLTMEPFWWFQAWLVANGWMLSRFVFKCLQETCCVKISFKTMTAIQLSKGLAGVHVSSGMKTSSCHCTAWFRETFSECPDSVPAQLCARKVGGSCLPSLNIPTKNHKNKPTRKPMVCLGLKTPWSTPCPSLKWPANIWNKMCLTFVTPSTDETLIFARQQYHTRTV